MGGTCSSQYIPVFQREVHNRAPSNLTERSSSVLVVWSRYPSDETLLTLGSIESMDLLTHETPSTTPPPVLGEQEVLTGLDLPKSSKASFEPMDDISSLSSFRESIMTWPVQQDFELRPSLV